MTEATSPLFDGWKLKGAATAAMVAGGIASVASAAEVIHPVNATKVPGCWQTAAPGENQPMAANGPKATSTQPTIPGTYLEWHVEVETPAAPTSMDRP
jgi:hypothetical protein